MNDEMQYAIALTQKEIEIIASLLSHRISDLKTKKEEVKQANPYEKLVISFFSDLADFQQQLLDKLTVRLSKE